MNDGGQIESGVQYYGVEKVVGMHISENNNVFYNVQWAPTWEPAECLKGCEHLIQDFLSRQSSCIKKEITSNLKVKTSETGVTARRLDETNTSSQPLNITRKRKCPTTGRKTVHNSTKTRKKKALVTFGRIKKRKTSDESCKKTKSVSSSSLIPQSTQNSELSNTLASCSDGTTSDALDYDDSNETIFRIDNVFGSNPTERQHVTANYSFANDVLRIHKEYLEFATKQLRSSNASVEISEGDISSSDDILLNCNFTSICDGLASAGVTSNDVLVTDSSVEQISSEVSVRNNFCDEGQGEKKKMKKKVKTTANKKKVNTSERKTSWKNKVEALSQSRTGGKKKMNMKDLNCSNIPQYYCCQCKKWFVTRKALRVHCRATHNYSLKKPVALLCALCRATFTHPTLLTRHVRGEHCGKKVSTPYQCGMCDVKMKCIVELESHAIGHEFMLRDAKRRKMKTNGKVGKIPSTKLVGPGHSGNTNTCKVRKNMTRKRPLPKTSSSWKCSMCKRSFVDFNRLLKHVELTHSATENEAHQKKIPNSIYGSSNIEKKRLHSITDALLPDKPSSSSIKNPSVISLNKARQNTNMKLEVNSHDYDLDSMQHFTGGSKWACAFCSAIFQYQPGLKRHIRLAHGMSMKKHSDEKIIFNPYHEPTNFSCPGCKKTFKTLAAEKSHTRWCRHVTKN